MMKGIDINGEIISAKEAYDLINMLIHDAREMAGTYHGMERSEKFRVNWPSEDAFAAANWKTFVEPVRQMYAERLNDPKLSPAEGRKFHLALVLQAMMGKGEQTDDRLQVFKDTPTFYGDRQENIKILEKFGKTPNLRAALLNSVVTQH